MNIVLVLPCDKPKKSGAHGYARIAFEIRKLLLLSGHDVDIWYHKTQAKSLGYDVAMIFNGNAFPPHETQIVALEQSDTALVWVTNEVNCIPYGSFAKLLKVRNSTLISQYPLECCPRQYFDHHIQVNLNSLLFKQYSEVEKTQGYIYYGTFKEDRLPYYKKWISPPVTLSALSTPSYKKFRRNSINTTSTVPIQWAQPVLRRFRYSLYFESMYAHTHYCGLAPRFYESIGAGAVVLFDPSCDYTLERSGYKNYEDSLIYHTLRTQFPYEKYAQMRELQSTWLQLCIAEKLEATQLILDLIGDDEESDNFAMQNHPNRDT